MWAAQQPADKRAFQSGYDDVELLGKLVTRGDAWPVAGLALHLQNGAVFGAVYAQLRPFLPGPQSRARWPWRWPSTWRCGRSAGWWTATTRPASSSRRSRATRARSRRPTWRHFVFGLVLGELERRLNTDGAEDEPPPVPASSNGHGNIEMAVGAA